MRAQQSDRGRVDRAVTIDETDQRVLELLAVDARLSSRALGREIGMSPGAVSERVARLEREGVIRGYHADVDPAALGFGMEVIIGLRTEQGSLLEEALDYLKTISEIQYVYVVSGQWDLVILIRVRDQEHLREMVLGRVWHVPAFRHSETLLVLDSTRCSVTWFSELMSTAGSTSTATNLGPDVDRSRAEDPQQQPAKPGRPKPTPLKEPRKPAQDC
jgi:DNA-binding Lrp family transcriptional regulator